ncbi:unnamed protein product, partial [Porites evermanni]
SVSFRGSIGINSFEAYLPGITDETPDMTNFKARRLYSSVLLSFKGKPASGPHTFKWTLNGTTLDPASYVEISSGSSALRVYGRSLANEGEYQVFVSNEFGTLFSRKIKLKFSVAGDFLRPNEPINITMEQNQPFLLRCPPRAYSYRVTYDWIVQSSQISIASNPLFAPRILMEPSGDLLFSFVDASQLDPVQCRITDLFGRRRSVGPPMYLLATIPAAQDSSSSTPKFYTFPLGEYTLLSGDQFYLNCTAGGRPVPSIQWYREGTLINDSGDFFQHHRFNRTLRLGSLSSKIHNGRYMCQAVSPSGDLTTSFDVKVIDNVTAIYSDSGSQYEVRAGKLGGRVTMFCNTTGHPIISRTWFYNGVEIQNRPEFAKRFSIDYSNGVLEVWNLRLNDFGFYQCLAKNKLSEDDRRTFLVVTGPPLPPVNVSVTDCANHTTNLTWDVRLPPDLTPPSGFIIEWRARVKLEQGSRSSPWPAFAKLANVSGATRLFVVNNMKAYNKIQFRIRAYNGLGIGFPGYMVSSLTCITNSKKPSLFPTKLEGSPGTFDGWLKITWKALDQVDWGGPSCLYRILYRLNAPNATWKDYTRKYSTCSSSQFNLYGLQPNSEYEITIQAENLKGNGPSSPIVKVLSGQSPPLAPEEVHVVRVDANSVEIEWEPINVKAPKTVDGYWVLARPGIIRNFGECENGPCGDEFQPIGRRRRAVGELPDTNFPNGTIGVRVDNGLRGVVTGLKPWSVYTMMVVGYNSAGLGQQYREVFTTLDSKDSYYILSLTITSETFTDDLRNENSSRYKSINNRLIREVSSIYQRHRWFKRVSLLGLSPGSVQARLQMEVASPDVNVVSDVIVVSNNLGNLSLNQNVTEVRSEPGIQNVMVNASTLIVYVGDRIVINCTVIGGPQDLEITWFKGNKLIGLTHRTKVDTGSPYSLLTIRDVMAEDEGNYSCQASKGIQRDNASVTVKVTPVLEIHPRAISKHVGDQATFSCTVVSGLRQGARVFVAEVTDNDNEVRHQETSFTAVNLQIPGERQSHTRRFVCEMSLQKQLLTRSEMAELVIVPVDAPKCPTEHLEGVSWVATVAGGMDIQPCPKGASGTAFRNCSQGAAWKDTNFLGCSSPEFLRLADATEAIIGGFKTDLTAQQVLSLLANFSRPVSDNFRRPNEIYGGDLVIAVNILLRLADYNSNQGSVSSAEDVNNYVQVASNLLDSVNSKTWQDLEREGRGRSQTLLKALDVYGLGVAATRNGSMIVAKNNLLLRIDRVKQDSLLRTTGLNVSYQQSSIYLPRQTFGAPDSRVVSLVYLTLNDVLPLAKSSSDDMPLYPNTTVVSSTVLPRPSDLLNDPPVKIILQNRGGTVPAGATPNARCVFWRPGEAAFWQTSGCRLVPSESDDILTTCECDHLTIFASLMDPYGASISEADKKALEIISIVGCTISLLAVLITIAVTLFFWKAVKSPRAKVLLNVCAALALSCISVIVEGSARDNKTGCTVVAVFLHYFLLALFSWMLCEGVLLYVLLVKVFGGGAEEKIKFFYIFGWGFPAVIVVISLAVTQAVGYGTSEKCWLDVPSGLIWAFIAPAIIIILINIVVFVLVIRQMMGTRHVQNKTQVEKVKAGLKATAVILPLLGITWLFGLLSFSSSTVAFKYMFAIFNSLQGLMIFIFHCLLNKQIKDAIKRRRDKSSSGVVSSTNKTKPTTLPSKQVTQPGKGTL